MVSYGFSHFFDMFFHIFVHLRCQRLWRCDAKTGAVSMLSMAATPSTWCTVVQPWNVWRRVPTHKGGFLSHGVEMLYLVGGFGT